MTTEKVNEYQPVKEDTKLRWPFEKDTQLTLVIAIILFIAITLLTKFQILSSNFIFLIVSIVVFVYIFLLYNELKHLTKIYRMDIAQLDWNKRNKEGMQRAINAQNGLGHSSIGESNILKARLDGENEITRRILEYKRDYIRSIFVPISSFLKDLK